MSLIKRENPAKVILIAAIAEAPILLAGIIMFLQTDNPVWIIGAAAIGAAIMVPAVLKAKKIQEQNDASR
ncbi:MAG: hypothetical protein AAF613_05565 [Pseudomonadota bacterium]